VLANVVASAERGIVLVDWAGTGRGPRAWPLAFLLYAEGARGLPRIDLVAAGYRQHVSLEPEELSRLPAMMRAAGRAGLLELLPGPPQPGGLGPRRDRG
jgi:Ser/Thr protein kinase RdoA (MazF antagonist)